MCQDKPVEDQLASVAKSPYWRGVSAARRVCRERQIGIEGKLAQQARRLQIHCVNNIICGALYGVQILCNDILFQHVKM
jgi:hypothetical protein